MSEAGDAPPKMPRWVKWPGIVIGVLAVVFIGMRLLGVQHGPGMHAPADPAGTHAPGGTHR